MPCVPVCLAAFFAHFRGERYLFTGIIEGLGHLAARETIGGDVRFTFHVGSLPFDNVQLGESIAINGVCLTVTAFDAQTFQADASTETLGLTTLGQLADGAVINLERAMRPTDRLGGHLVSGHVDGLGQVLSIHEDARAQRWRFAAPAGLL